MKPRKSIHVTLDSETYDAFAELAREDGRTIPNALCWLAKYAVHARTLCPMAVPITIPVDEVKRRIHAALAEPWNPNQVSWQPSPE